MIKPTSNRVPELAKLRINHYYSFGLTNKFKNVFAIAPLEKVGNHETFNLIFTNETVDVRQSKCSQIADQIVDYIIMNQHGRNLSLLVYLKETDMDGELRFNHLLPPHRCKLGYGRVNGNIPDAALFKVTDDLVFEVYIVNGGKPYVSRLFKLFTDGEFETEIEALRIAIPKEENDRLIDKHKNLNGQNSYINTNLLKIS